MRKIFFLTALLMMILTATAFAEDTPASEQSEQATTDEPYIYTSEDFKFSIACPIKPLAVIENPWQEPERRGEMLVFAYGDESVNYEILYAYKIEVDAFKNEDVPDFNNSKAVAAIGNYIADLKEKGGFSEARLVDITKKNKGVSAITPDKIEVLNKETGEVEGEFIADRQDIYTFFRTPEGRCISIQLICVDINNKQAIKIYQGGVSSFKDLSKDKKFNKKDKKDKKDKKKDKKK